MKDSQGKEFKKKYPYYVRMEDTLMSSPGKTGESGSIIYIGCDTKREAAIVEDNAKSREEMKDIEIVNEITDHGPGFFVQFKDKSDIPKWFESRFFNY
jgi:hypothetical protein